MIDVESFQLVSEVSITFTGLAGIASVLGSSSLRTANRTWRIRNMITLSLITFFLSLIPQGASLFSLDASLVWQLSSFLMMGSQIAQFLYGLFSRAASTGNGLLVVYMTGSIFIFGFQGYNILQDTPGAGLFFLGLAWLMFLASLNFFVLVINSDIEEG